MLVQNGSLRLTDKADLSIYFDADTLRYDPGWLKQNGMTREFFIAFYENCPSVGFEMDGVQIGGMIFDRDRTGEVHFAVLPAYHGRWKNLWQPALNWLFQQQYPVYVKVERFNEKCIRFMDRHGYERVNCDDQYLTYRMTSAIDAAALG